MQDPKEEASVFKHAKKTVVIGASENPERYAYMASHRLHAYGHEVVPIGIRKGKILDTKIQLLSEKPSIPNADTITLYIGPQNQPQWEEYLLSLNPRRIIFNPGTENPEFQERAKKKGIETIEACTLVMLSVGNY